MTGSPSKFAFFRSANINNRINIILALFYFFLVWFSLVSLFNGISIFVGYLMPKPSSTEEQ